MRPNYLAIVSVTAASIGAIGQAFACLLCWMPIVAWIPLGIALLGTCIGLAAGIPARAQGMQTGIGKAAADLGIGVSLTIFTCQILMMLAFGLVCGLPILLAGVGI